MSISVVQTLAASETTNSDSLQSGAFGSPTTTGNTIVVCLTGSFSSADTVSLSDTEGNTYTCLYANGYSSGATDVLSNPATNNIPASTPFVSIWIAQNITGSSSLKITATIPSGPATSGLDIAAAEVSGLGTSVTTDVTQAGNGVASAGNPATGSFSTTNANDIIFVAMVGTGSATGASITMPTGFTQIGEFALSGKFCLGFGYEIVSSTQSSINPTFTTAHMNSATAIAVAYKQGSSTPGVPTGLAAAYASATSIALTWSQGSGTVTDNEVQYQANGTSGAWTTVDIGSAATSYTVTSLTPGTLYFFQVNAGDAGSYSSYCTPVPWVCGSSFTGQTTNNAYQNNSGTVTIADSTDTVSENNYLGFLFADVAVPQYAMISQAALYVYVPSGTPTDAFPVDCQLSTSAANFAATTDNISNRTLTGDGVVMNVGSWGTGWNQSPNLQSPVKAVVNQSGWASGNPIAVVIDGAVVAGPLLTVEMASGSSTEAAILAIFTTTDDGTCHFEQSDSVFETSVHKGARMVGY